MELHSLIETIGYAGVFGIVFAESGLLFGFFLPGDSLLFTAGFLASQGIFDIWVLSLGCFLAAVFGDTVGYMFGHKVGRRLFHKKESFFFHKDNLQKAEIFYEKHGGKTIILARFLPFIRTFAPIVAGIGNMHYPTFFIYNIVGGLLWGVGLTFTGYYLGRFIPDVDQYLIPIIFGIIFISLAPSLLPVIGDRERRRELINSLKKLINKNRR
jgi:membrane-associated protein